MSSSPWWPKYVAPKAAGTLPAGLSATDMAFQIARHPEHETGEVERGWTRHRITTDTHGLDLPVIPQWHRQAECAKPEYAGLDFFHLRAGAPGTFCLAREACEKCAVRLDCLEDALTHECEVRLCFGLRGGMTARERLSLIREGETRGRVYFGWGHGLVKIGTTRGHIAERARVHGVTMLATEPGSYTRERQLHKVFAEDREHGEWFRPSERLLAYIAALPDQIVTAAERELVAA